ncbi:shikimate kinase [Candidatus Woesearchaeota archaeon]|nr:MAG: shikimate kinase [Candidatus Woesearchaeota archaeon]
MIITNIGLPYSGKSEIGRRVAKKLGMHFVDVDDVLQERIGDLQKCVEEKGERYFLDAEREVLMDLQIQENTIYAPGGSFIHHPMALSKFRAQTDLVYFRIGFDEWVRRLDNSAHQRGIVGFQKGVRCVYDEMVPLLEFTADVTISAKDFNLATKMYEDYIVRTKKLLEQEEQSCGGDWDISNIIHELASHTFL